jgi:deoxyribodipyrimidine photo-lyase
MTALVWFRNDLRVDDNTALHNALDAGGRVAAVFYATPAQWSLHDMAAVRGEFLWRTLESLHGELAKLNVPLLVRQVPLFEDIPADLAALAAELQISTVYSNREYAIDEVRRDTTARQKLAAAAIDWRDYDDATLLPPRSVRTLQGLPYKVYTPFRRAVLKLLGDGVLDCRAAPGPAERWFEAPALPPYPYECSAVDPQLWPAGECAAAARLREFMADGVRGYETGRDLPAQAGTSGLSPYLALGAISARRCAEAALVASTSDAASATGAGIWLNELLWREFYIHVLAEFPRVAMHQPLRRETAAVPWRNSPAEFAQWRDGRTGYPLVDAAQRQLLETGWMHNRLRMVVAIFLCKYLLLDWRLGERHFMRHLIDGDLAANNGGWQWCASTGTDAVPYFRLLSPVRQAERFDPDAQFIKRFLPELRALPARSILQPGHPELLAAGYPAPMVDLAFARGRALDAFSGVGRGVEASMPATVGKRR